MNNTLPKSINNLFSKKAVLICYFFIQMLIIFLSYRVLNDNEYNLVDYASLLLVLIYSFVVFIAILLNNKNNRIISYYSISTMVLSFMLIIDLYYLRDNPFYYRYIYIQIIVLFIILDIILKILAQDIGRGLFYKYIIVVLWTMGVVLGVSNTNLYMLIYQITFLIVSFYPIVFFVLNFKRIKSYADYLLPVLFLLVLVNIIFILWVYFVDDKYSGNHNYDLHIYLNIIEIILSCLILSALEFWKLVKKKRYSINSNMLIKVIFICGYLYCFREQLAISLFYIISIIMIIEECHLLRHYNELLYNEETNSGYMKESNLFENMIERNISDFEKEELYKEQVSDFLHDIILQDAILLKSKLEEHYSVFKDEKLFEIANGMINKTRNQINLYKPAIDYKIRMSKNYYDLIRSIRSRFNDRIIIDFICDDDLFLSPPYDLVIYKILHELVNNIFKHSKGDCSAIELDVKNNIIILNVKNYGDYLINDVIINSDSKGLKIIKREVDRYGGIFTISSSNDFEDSIVDIKVEIPIKGESTYENFINR